MARPRNQAHRRRQLVRATNELVARKGMAGVRLRDVAEHAGLTPGAVLYYYDGLDELFFNAYEAGIHRYCEECEEAIADLAGPVAQLMSDYVERQVDMYEQILTAGVESGDFEIAGDLRAAARVIVAMEDGHGPYVLTGQVTPADAERLFLRHAALVTGVPLRRLAASGRRVRTA
jgi:AcrR family transcriptional regulator